MVTGETKSLSSPIGYVYAQEKAQANLVWPGWVRAIIIIGLSSFLWGVLGVAFFALA